MNKQLFFLGYNAADYLNGWFKKENYSGVDFHFIDNGKQKPTSTN
jgi:hypothetical protein